MGQADGNGYNLLDERWIPVLRQDGRFEHVGIKAALTEAGTIRQIAASNPMDRVALLRFLLAVLLWCKPDLSDEDRAQLESADGISEGWLNKLEENKAKFNLLGEGKRFYQDKTILDDLLKSKQKKWDDKQKKKKSRTSPKSLRPTSLDKADLCPIANLLVEFPGADSVNHMRHVVHGSYGFCPACCALGILRLSVWASANQYYPASVNPGSAAYAITEGSDLLLTLAANLPEATAHAGDAPWLSNAPPCSAGAASYLAWRPRKLWLNVARDPGTCANCGGAGVMIESLCNEGGWPTPTTPGATKKFWAEDPHLLKDGEPISLPGLGTNVGAHSSRFWRDALDLRGARAGKVVAIGPVVIKFTFQDAVCVDVPKSSAQTRAGLTADCNKKLRGLLKQVTPNPDRRHPEIHAAIVLLTPDTEGNIRASLDAPGATADDGEHLREIFEPLVERVLASTARGSPLRRRAAMNDAQRLLRKVIDKLVNSANQPPGSAAVDGAAEKPKRARKKKVAAT
ncbi:MAG: type I-E CRISPR-associated protein Cse1/CasA [Phycisphaerales bacterium]|nr:type I-E CRISPR-associated protein Cse1/CasA [Phycisphaerales bacterium]